jgi:GNAT superfamily N-acetyltransferase
MREPAVEIHPLVEDEMAVVERTVPRIAGRHRERLTRQERGEALYLFAWFGAEQVGHVLLTWSSAPGPGTAHVEDLGVEEDWRRRRVGTQLMTRCEREVHSRGLERIALSVGIENGPARRFYRTLGYVEPAGQLPHVLRYPYVDETGAVRTAAESCTTFVKRLASGG